MLNIHHTLTMHMHIGAFSNKFILQAWTNAISHTLLYTFYVYMHTHALTRMHTHTHAYTTRTPHTHTQTHTHKHRYTLIMSVCQVANAQI